MTDTRVPPAPSRPVGEDTVVPRPRMDPRIRERRVAVRRDAGRRRLRVLLVCAGAAAAIGAGYGVTRSPLLDVDRVRLTGAAVTAAADIERAGGLDGRPQLADVEPAEVAQRVEALPWVQEAEVVRHWPGTVAVRVIERQPLATMPAASGWARVDRTGRVLDVAPEPGAGLAVVAAVAAAPGAGAVAGPEVVAALGVVDALPPSLSEVLEQVTVAEDGALSFTLRRLPEVRFGTAVQVGPKLVALSTLVARVDLRGVSAIDVRVPTAPVLTRP